MIITDVFSHLPSNRTLRVSIKKMFQFITIGGTCMYTYTDHTNIFGSDQEDGLTPPCQVEIHE